MRRRRRRSNTWFPNLGFSPTDQGTSGGSGRPFILPVNPDGDFNTLIVPLVPDTPVQGQSLDATEPGNLVRHLGQEYIIERIVGKLFAALEARRNAGNDPSVPVSALFGAGIFVARVSDVVTSTGAADQQPIGADDQSDRHQNYGPLALDTIREPWMWRRVWALGNRAFNDIAAASQVVLFNGANATDPRQGFPYSTAHYGSVMDGPHIDCKSNRRVRNDERLFLSVESSIFPGNAATPVNNAISIAGYIDYRVLGHLVKAKNVSTF